MNGTVSKVTTSYTDSSSDVWTLVYASKTGSIYATKVTTSSSGTSTTTTSTITPTYTYNADGSISI
jgi:hypothetical protein